MAPERNRVVFVGNIPYGVSEELLSETLSRVGHVVNFRLVHDKDTGKPKGFGFAEYADPDSAASAVRNLNDVDIMGRKLRVDWSNDGGSNESTHQQATTGYAPPNQNGQAGTAPNLLPELPQGAQLPAGIDSPDAISRTLRALPPPQLLDMISQMKGLVMSDPAQATLLFQQAPQLAYAMFQALLLLGLVDNTVLKTVLENPHGQGAPPAAVPPPVPIPSAPPAIPQPFGQPPPNPYAQQSGQPGYMPTPPPLGQHQPPVPPPVQPPTAAPDPREALIRQVLSMPQSQIDALPPAQRDQINMLKQQLSAGQMPF